MTDTDHRLQKCRDPLRGVVDVRGPFGLVQIMNYGGRSPAVIDGGLAAADTVIRSGSRPRIAPLPHLDPLIEEAMGEP